MKKSKVPTDATMKEALAQEYESMFPFTLRIILDPENFPDFSLSLQKTVIIGKEMFCIQIVGQEETAIIPTDKPNFLDEAVEWIKQHANTNK